MKYQNIYFTEKSVLRFLDQTAIPKKVRYIECKTDRDVRDAIAEEKITGQAVGIAAAYGMALSLDCLVRPNGQSPRNWNELLEELSIVAAAFVCMIPTSSHLKFHVSEMLNFVKSQSSNILDIDRLFDDMVGKAKKCRKWISKIANTLGREDHFLSKMGVMF